jgi:cysteinyl-tRNA synthetase
MDQDFGTPEAIAVLFELAAEVNRTRSVRLAEQLRALGGVLGLLQQVPQDFLQAGAGGIGEQEVADLVAQRQQAKAGRDFARADQIRQQLADQGILLKDGPAGTTWERV